MKTLHIGGDHRTHRKAAFEALDIGEQLDAIAKGFEALRNLAPLPPETLAWLDARAAIKARFPDTSERTK